MASTQIRGNDILDGTITGAKISAGAAIDSSKITPPGLTQQILYNNAGVLSANASLVWNVNTFEVTGSIRFTQGIFGSTSNATAPAYSVFGDSDTGVYSPAANEWAVSTGAVERIRITSAGRLIVGIGVPTTEFHVVGTALLTTAAQSPIFAAVANGAANGNSVSLLSNGGGLNQAGGGITILAGTGASAGGNGQGGPVTITGGGGGGVGGGASGGTVSITGGTGHGGSGGGGASSLGGTVSIAGGTTSGTGGGNTGGPVTIAGGSPPTAGAIGGALSLSGGTGGAGGTGGSVSIAGGTGGTNGAINMATAGTNRLRLEAGGNVVVGSGTSLEKLTVEGRIATNTTLNGDLLYLAGGSGIQGLRVRSTAGVDMDVKVDNSGGFGYAGQTSNHDFRLITNNLPRVYIAAAGNVGIGSSTLTSMFNVGSAAQLQVDSSGDIVKLKNLTYSWPTSHATSGYVLTNNGSGTLTWAAGGGGGGSITGSGVANQVTYWSGASAITGDTSLTFTPAAGLALALPASASPGTISMVAANNNTNGPGGQVNVTAGNGIGAFNGGDVVLTGGNTAVASGNAAGAVRLVAGNNSAGSAGSRITVGNALTLTGSAEPGIDMTLTFPGTNDTGRIFLNSGYPNGSIRISTGILALVIDSAGLSTFSGDVAATTYLAVGGATMGTGGNRIKMPNSSFIVWETTSCRIGGGATNMVVNAASGANSVLVNYGGSGTCGSGGLIVYGGNISGTDLKFRVDPAGTTSYIIGNFGVNTSSPTGAALHVVGAVKMVDGNQAASKIMLSDANGVGSWGQYADRQAALGNSGATETINWASGLVQTITLDSNCTFSYTGAISGQTITLFIKQDATGSRLVTWPTTSWPGGTAPTLTTTANKTDIITVFYDGTTYWGFTGGLNY